MENYTFDDDALKTECAEKKKEPDTALARYNFSKNAGP